MQMFQRSHRRAAVTIERPTTQRGGAFLLSFLSTDCKVALDNIWNSIAILHKMAQQKLVGN